MLSPLAALAPVLGASAIATLLWTPLPARSRMLAVCGRSGTGRSSNPVLAIPVAVPVAGFLIGGVAAATAAGIIVAVVVWVRRKRQWERRFDQQMEDLLLALSLMVAELSVGAPPVRACEVAVAELRRRERDAPGTRSEIADGLESMAWRASLGGSVIDAPAVGSGVVGPGAVGLGQGGASSGIASWRRIGIAWQTAERQGLPMVDMLAALRSDLASRRGFTERTRAGLSGPRATAMVLAGLPLLGIALGQATGAGPIQVLLGGGLGGILLVVGCALAAAGIAWSERITGKVLAR
ncbi:type II secretion system protein F [Gordonia jinghuaiqii]|uniref:Type II secretion system protein F n=1 Tax=Gordonia jinghuaiqii TaxID=2758710 RepID=A0A7D7R0H4_9ACTN|nr:type II secretion system protein F [Gordonia jinghuaiqii]MCR5980212.1 type II secretion system protein F [Gordonia jinghuaiqii]QMT02031.1 type II secretion system protein F [Gordonia jinghuaiqii]